jgi:hypothetical protein
VFKVQKTSIDSCGPILAIAFKHPRLSAVNF